MFNTELTQLNNSSVLTAGLLMADSAFCFLKNTANKIARDIGWQLYSRAAVLYNLTLGYHTGKVRMRKNEQGFIPSFVSGLNFDQKTARFVA
ncbi:MAG TPA: hypothetical protein PLP33_25920 [Leptospiraceae bacterium]|nr:hypothetical protein [Leptospiraceae bacterium]